MTPQKLERRKGLRETIDNTFKEYEAGNDTPKAVDSFYNRAYSLLSSTESQARASLEFLGLLDRADLPASTLPHGDQRLVEIAMALAQRPALLLVDEPTQGLSPEDTAAAVAVIRQIARERALTILLVEHDMDVVFNLADRISVLHLGQLIAEGSPAEIRANVEVQKAYLGGIA